MKYKILYALKQAEIEEKVTNAMRSRHDEDTPYLVGGLILMPMPNGDVAFLQAIMVPE